MSSVDIKKEKKVIPTYVPKKANDLPMFFENRPYQGASGKLYPIPYSDGISDDKTDVEYDVYTLENEYVKTQVLPEIGGKILRGFDKVGNYDFIYYNEVVKPALVGLAGAWISGGIEFNWPQHHRPTTYMPLEAVVEENADGGKTVWTGEVEPMNRMKGMAGITLDKGRSYIKAKVRVYNRTNLPQLFMWWANLAVPVNDSYRTVFPPDVEWVNDHDRRAVLEWPIAKGLYKTARPYNFGDGTDISRYSAIKVPSSYLVSQGQSDMDFVSGYDEGLDMGIVTVADHHISPGKKMWHWGKGDFGDMWCNNLTDKNGPYIELMTGVYTDNQPDFTWIAPYETREFEQFWYPVRDIGIVKNATIDAAMNMEKRGEDLFFGFNVTGKFKNAHIKVSDKNGAFYEETLDMSPDKSYLKTLPLEGRNIDDVTVSLADADGNVLVSYTPYKRGQKKPIDVRKPVRRPSEIDNLEELYLNGLHLEQYKQHNYNPRDYYLEGLKRDEFDSRCNTGMARLSLKSGDFEACVEYADKAIKRLTIRNQHPTDTEAMYLKGVALKYLGRYKEATDELSRAAWSYAHRSAAYFELANIDCINGEYEAALEKLNESLGLNKGHTLAQNLKAAILRVLGRKDEAKRLAVENAEDDKLDFFALVELSYYKNVSSRMEQFTQKPENVIDVVIDYMNAGLYESAVNLIETVGSDYPLMNYYYAYCLEKLGRDGSAARKAANDAETGYCFPSRLSDILVLTDAYNRDDKNANAYYYLGCLLFDKERYSAAREAFEKCVSIDPKHKKAFRNLSLLYFDKFGMADEAKSAMEKALANKPDDPRLLFEYQQLLKNMNFGIDERLAVYGKYSDLLDRRDDCYLDKMLLVAMKGDYKNSIDSAAHRRFHIYEGGEGRLTSLHAWIHVLYGNELAESSNADEAKHIYENGAIIPKSYGEAKTFFNQEAHIYYFLGELLEKQGDKEGAKAAFEKAGEYKAAVSEISLFRALALRKTGDNATAKQVLDEMLASAQNMLVNSDLRSYYGVGSPTPMPFEYDIVKHNVRDGSILKAFALLGTEGVEAAEKAMAPARELDPFDFKIYVFDKIKGYNYAEV